MLSMVRFQASVNAAKSRGVYRARVCFKLTEVVLWHSGGKREGWALVFPFDCFYHSSALQAVRHRLGLSIKAPREQIGISHYACKRLEP